MVGDKSDQNKHLESSEAKLLPVEKNLDNLLNNLV